MKKEYLLLAALMLAALAMRLFFAFQDPNLSGDAGYFTLRQVEHIRDTGVPLTNDPLSYGGRHYFPPPLWYYILALPSLFFPPIAVLKVLPNLCMVLLIPLCFRLARRFTDSNLSALAAAALAAWVPATFHASLNDASPSAFALLLFFVALEGFFDLTRSGAQLRCALAIILLGFTDSLLLVLAAVLLLYLILARTERLKLSRAEWEFTLFTLLFAVWVHLIFFKQELWTYGWNALWGAIPKAVLANYFADITLLQAISAIGSLPFLYGLYAAFHTVFGAQRRKEHYLLLSMLLIPTIALWLKVIPLRAGLPLLGLGLSVAFGHFLDALSIYLKHLKALWLRAVFAVAIAVLMLFTSIIPATLAARQELRNTISADDLMAIRWLREHTNPQEVVLARVEEGNIIAALAQRPTIADTQFHFAPNAEQRYEDLKRIFTTSITGEALALLAKYNVSMVYLSPETRKTYGGQGLAFFNAQCFDLAYNTEVRIYEIRCRSP